MATYLHKAEGVEGACVALDDLILTKDCPTTGGSRMLDGYLSLFDAEAVTRLAAAGYGMAGKLNMGEFGADLLGESSYAGACVTPGGQLTTAAAEVLRGGEVAAVVGMDVNGVPRRSAAQAGQVCVKPTYGIVSRFGTIAVACSGEAVCVTANTAAVAGEVLAVLAGHDDKDGTSLPEAQCRAAVDAAAAAPIARVAVPRGLVAMAQPAVQDAVAAAAEALRAAGVQVDETDAADEALALAGPAWNVLFAAELCNNVSRFDGVKYGYRSQDYLDIDELYTNSRTEAFGPVLKTLILFGSDALATENYDRLYDKALRIRRVVVDAFAQLFGTYQAVLLPAAGALAYDAATAATTPYAAFAENRFTAPASISGLPAVVAGGVQLVGPALTDAALLQLAATLTKEA